MTTAIQAHIFDADGCIFTDELVARKKSSNRLVDLYDEDVIKPEIFTDSESSADFNLNLSSQRAAPSLMQPQLMSKLGGDSEILTETNSNVAQSTDYKAPLLQEMDLERPIVSFLRETVAPSLAIESTSTDINVVQNNTCQDETEESSSGCCCFMWC
jgi:hypothetical protein